MNVDFKLMDFKEACRGKKFSIKFSFLISFFYISFVDYGVDITYDQGPFDMPAPVLINKLMNAISVRNKDNQDQILLAMDEITTDSDGYDYDVVNFDKQANLDFLGAINPAGSECKEDYVIKVTKQKNVHVEKLCERYRYTFEIGLFLAHLNDYYNRKPQLYKKYLKEVESLADPKIQRYRCIDMFDDKPLSSFKLPRGKKLAKDI